MTLRILADENIPSVEHYLGNHGRVQRVNGRALQSAQLQDVDILLVRSVTRVNEALLAGTPVQFVGTATSGVDHIDRNYLAGQGIAFAYAPGSNANSVVEYVLSATAAVGGKLEQLLGGGALGIVGFGLVGKALAARLKALNIRYRVYDPWLDQGAIPHAASLDEILGCDVICLHPELTTEQPWPSYHLLGPVELQRLDPEALLINASRGPVVDNAALLAHVDGGRGPLVVLDVWEQEPDISASLLQRVALGTAHIAGYSHDGKLEATRMLSAAVTAHLQLPPPPGDDPEGDAPTIRVSDCLSGAELVRTLLHARYDIRRDDTLLREAILGSERDCGEAFDQLRRTYPQRRELIGSRIETGSDKAEHRAIIEALGCIPVTPGKDR